MLKSQIGLFVIFFLIINLFDYDSFAQDLPQSYYDEAIKSYRCTGSKIDINFLLDTINSNTIIDTALLACCYHQIGLQLFKKADYLKSIKYNNLAAKLREVCNDGLYWKSLRNIGICYIRFSDYQRAVIFFEMANNVYKNKEPKYEAQILRYMADAITEMGEYDRAKSIMMQAFKINTSENDIAKAHRRLSNILISTEDSIYYNKAIYHAKQAVEKSEKGITKMHAFNNLAMAFHRKGDYNKAIEYYHKYLILAEFDGDKKSKLWDLIIWQWQIEL